MQTGCLPVFAAKATSRCEYRPISRTLAIRCLIGTDGAASFQGLSTAAAAAGTALASQHEPARSL